MSVRAVSLIREERFDEQESRKKIKIYRWTGLKEGDTGFPLAIPHLSGKSVQVYGTFGTGGNLRMEGSNMPLDATHAIEKVTNGGFTGAATGWTFNHGVWSYNANAIDKDQNGTGALTQDVSVVAGKLYQVVFTITAISVGNVTPSLGGVSGTQRSTADTFSEYILATGTGALTFTPSNTSRFTIDNVSVIEVAYFFTLADPQGNALDITAAKGEQLLEDCYQVRPFVTAGDGNTDLTVYLLAKSSD